MSNISGDENHLCGASLRKSYKISSKDHAHGIDYHQHQRYRAGTPGDYRGSDADADADADADVSQFDSFTLVV